MSSLLFKVRVVFLLLKSVPLFHSLSNVNCEPGRQRPIFYRERERDRQKCPISKCICGRVRKRKVSCARVSVCLRARVCMCVVAGVCACVLPKTLADAFLLASSMVTWCAS